MVPKLSIRDLVALAVDLILAGIALKYPRASVGDVLLGLASLLSIQILLKYNKNNPVNRLFVWLAIVVGLSVVLAVYVVNFSERTNNNTVLNGGPPQAVAVPPLTRMETKEVVIEAVKAALPPTKIPDPPPAPKILTVHNVVNYLRDQIRPPYNVPFPIGSPFALNLPYTNTGPEPIELWWGVGKIYLRDNATDETQKELVNTFQKTMIPKGTPPATNTISLGEHMFFTATGETIRAETLQALADGKQIMFLIAEITFEDQSGKHHVPLCEWMYAPGQIQPTNLAMVQCHLFNHAD